MNDVLSQLVGMMAKSVLPQGHTHAAMDQKAAVNDGRVDVLISHAAFGFIATVENPMVGLLAEAARPIIDGAITMACGPVAIRKSLGIEASGPQNKRKRSIKTGAYAPKTTALAKRAKAKGKGKEFTKDGREILDAEFVDLPNEARR